MICSKMAAEMPLAYNYTKGRKHSIDTITVHHMAGNLSLKSCHNLFNQEGRRASSNYAIDTNGNVACYVSEDNTSWCSSSTANDTRAVTIEVANCGGAPDWKISDAAAEALTQLCADICRRNNIPKLLWRNDPTLAGYPAKQNLTIHRWFKNKVCPGPYIEKNLGILCRDVNEIIGASGAFSAQLTGLDLYDMEEVALNAGYHPFYVEEWGERKIYIGYYKAKSTTAKYQKRLDGVDTSVTAVRRIHPLRGGV